MTVTGGEGVKKYEIFSDVILYDIWIPPEHKYSLTGPCPDGLFWTGLYCDFHKRQFFFSDSDPLFIVVALWGRR